MTRAPIPVAFGVCSAVCALFAGFGCGGGGGSPSSSRGTGQVTVLLADGPADEYDHIFVTLTEVTLIPSNGRRPVVLFEPDEPAEVDLLDLRDEDLILAVRDGVPAGRYAKIRVGVEAVRPVGGPCEDLVTVLPSGHIDIHPRGGFDVTAGGVLFIRLDLDADKSIHLHPAGSSGRCIFRPVVFVDVEELGPERCPRALAGTILSIEPPPPPPADGGGAGAVGDGAGDGGDESALWRLRVALESGRGPITVLASEDGTRVFDEDGLAASLASLAAGDSVRIRGRFDLEGRFRAQLIVVGGVVMLDGVASSDFAGGVFAFQPAEGQSVVGELNVEISAQTLVQRDCLEEIGPEAIRAGSRVHAVGKLVADTAVLRAILLVVEPPPPPRTFLESLAASAEGIELHLITRDGDMVTPSTVFLPAGVPVHFGRDQEFPLDLLQALLACRMLPVAVETDSVDPAIAIAVEVEAERQGGLVVAVDADEGLVRLLSGATLQVVAGARILELTDDEDREIALSDLRPGTRVRAFGVAACAGADPAFYAFSVLALSAPQDREPHCPPGRFRTFGHGAWGTECNGENPGCFRDAHFAAAFPAGVTIGCEEGFSLHFDSSAAVERFLPQGGRPGVLGASAVDPEASSAGIFAGQLLALTLNVGFDDAVEDFGASLRKLHDLIVIDSMSPCHGLTVGEILLEANRVIGGCESPLGLSPHEVKDCVSAVNANFEHGTEPGMLLDCEEIGG